MKNTANVIKGAAAGLLGGLVASWVMNRFQDAWSELTRGSDDSHGAQSQQTLSPDHGAGAFLRGRGADDPNDDAAMRTANVLATAVLDHPLSKREKKLGGTIVHYAVGATTGAIYGAASEVIPPLRTGVGLPFGVAVWLVVDEGAVPALGLSRSAFEYPASIHAYALASHLVYGLTTDLAQRIIRRSL